MIRLYYTKILIISATCLWLTACAISNVTHLPDNQSPAAQLYIKKCRICHALPHPKRHTAEQWNHILGLMKRRMEEKNFPPLTADESATLLNYLNKHGR